MKRWTLLAAYLLLISVASAQNAREREAVTIRLFSVRPVETITVVPLGRNEKIRACTACPETEIHAPILLKRNKEHIQFSGDAKPSDRISLNGLFQVRAEGYEESDTASGIWDIRATPTGLCVLLTTSTEHYVMAVLSGEAAQNEPMESLKAMAVAARTFALVNQQRHAAEGFNLCDNTHCQALRFSGFRPEIEQAVRATAGETLWYGAHRADVYMTQHCGGETEDAASVWPNVRAPYLRSHADPYCLRHSDGKWHADVELTQMVHILQEQGWMLPARIESVRIIKRTAAGRAQLLEISGSGKSAQVSASSFRFAVNRALGWNQLRSDRYEITRNNAMLHFEGKGYGHGVGLCQAGAFQMAGEGHNYRDILGFYYPGTQVRITQNDSGWQERPGKGWTLVSAGSSGNVLNAGNAVWEKAWSLFPPKSPAHPIVHLMPSTELFRLATGEPGWMLASTHGADISLQPVAIIQAHGDASSVLLHEFLHVLVEQEAIPQTPLWLREGMVEALADKPRPAQIIPLPALERMLAHPASMADSQRAHAAAGQLVQELIRRYGLTTVRSWLHGGVPSTVPAQV